MLNKNNALPMVLIYLFVLMNRAAHEQFDIRLNWDITILLFAVIVLLVSMRLLLRRLPTSLASMLNLSSSIANGKFDNVIGATADDEPGKLKKAFCTMQVKLETAFQMKSFAWSNWHV